MVYEKKLCSSTCKRCGKRRAKGDCNLLLCRKCCLLVCQTKPYGVDK